MLTSRARSFRICSAVRAACSAGTTNSAPCSRSSRRESRRQYYRSGYLTDGKRLIWEYPRDAGNGEQMDFVEAMELNGEGLIQRHCVYWGWFGVRVLQRDEYHH
jgi:hypothetical protein